MSEPVSIFCSYSHRDEALRVELVKHLRVLERQKKIVVWHDRWIRAGEQWEKEISQQLERADIILLLITKEFIASRFCYEEEMAQALVRAEAGTAQVIPIILEPVYSEGETFKTLQVLPKDARPVTKWGDRNDAFVNVVEGIAAVVQQMQQDQAPPPSLMSFGAPQIQSPPELGDLGGQRRTDPSNPFGDRGRITAPDRFFDRKELLRQIFEELGKGGSLSLVGESRIGKSSILQHICQLGPQRWLGRGPVPEFVYLSLQLVADENDFYESLCHELGIGVCQYSKLTRALRGKRYVLCLDEMEKMAGDGFTRNLRGYLRGLADGGDTPLTLVIASRSPLEYLFPDSPELDSPLAGICRQLDVKPFTEVVMRDFLAHRLRNTGIAFSEVEIARLWSETQGHPALVQELAANRYNQLSQD